MRAWIIALVAASVLVVPLGVVDAQVAPHTDLEAALAAAMDSSKDVMLILNYTNGALASSEPEDIVQALLADSRFEQLAADFEVVELKSPGFELSGDTKTGACTRVGQLGGRYRFIDEPTVLVMTPLAEPYGRTVLEAGQVEPFIGQIQSLTANRDRCLGTCRDLLADKIETDGAKLEAAYMAADFAVGDLHTSAMTVIGKQDLKDSRSLLATAALEKLLMDQLATDAPDWKAFRTAAEGIQQATPSVARLGNFHGYLALARAQLGDFDAAQDSLDTALQKSRVNPLLVGKIRTLLNVAR